MTVIFLPSYVYFWEGTQWHFLTDDHIFYAYFSVSSGKGLIDWLIFIKYTRHVFVHENTDIDRISVRSTGSRK